MGPETEGARLDQQVLKAHARGDEAAIDAAWEAWCEHHKSWIVRLVRSWDVDEPDAIFMDAVLAAYIKIRDGRYEQRDIRLVHYVIGIAKNLTRDARRRAKASLALSEELEETGQLAPDAVERVVEDIIIKREARQRLRDYISRLPGTQRYVMTSYFLHGVATDEIAKRLGLTPAAVRKARSRATAAVREMAAET